MIVDGFITTYDGEWYNLRDVKKFYVMKNEDNKWNIMARTHNEVLVIDQGLETYAAAAIGLYERIKSV